MNDELKARLTKYLDALEAGVAKGGDFIGDQAPEVAREWLAWEFWDSITIAVVFLLAAILCGFAVRLVAKMETPASDDAKTSLSILALGLLVLIGLSLFMIASYGKAAVKVCVAPRVVLIEKVAEVVKGK